MGLFVGIAVLALVVGARYDVRGRKGMRTRVTITMIETQLPRLSVELILQDAKRRGGLR
jgi:hypothetical protein